MRLLIYLALLPVVILLAYVYHLDKIEKEPAKLLLKTLLFGVISAIPALILELIMGVGIGIVTSILPYTIVYAFLEAFFSAALMEELVKYTAVRLAIWKKPDFNYRFDAVVYCVFASLGFAGIENVLYVMDGGISTAIMRALTSIPGHATFGVYMGIYLGAAKLCQVHGDTKGYRSNRLKALLVPILIHGFYDFCLMSENDLLIYIWFAFVVIMDILVMIKLNKASKSDVPFVDYTSQNFTMPEAPVAEENA
ncbi:MAG: PrsW family intramembrane metalloprotease [Lachnospiraceae bacterium]|nr:PrsW family intramembrane metalloprotease [Candidatus Equihabitans merdae]